MAKVLVTEAYLQDIADSIRGKNGSTDTYTPAEMSGAIDDIPTGITPTGTKQISITQNGTTTEDVTNYANAQINVSVPSSSPTLVTKTITANGTYNASSDNADGYSSVTVNVSGGGGEDTLSKYVLNQLTSFVLPSGTYINGALSNASNLKSITFPNTPVGLTSSFAQSTGLESVFIHGLSYTAGQGAFRYCSSMKTIVISGTVNTSYSTGQYFCQNGTSLEAIDIDCNVYSSAFSGCSILDTIVLRRTSGVQTLNNVNAFTGTPFASGGAGGTLYVPQALKASYQAANNWSTLLGYSTNSIQAIEGSIYETKYVDGTSI